jgi:hypothetical protein
MISTGMELRQIFDPIFYALSYFMAPVLLHIIKDIDFVPAPPTIEIVANNAKSAYAD